MLSAPSSSIPKKSEVVTQRDLLEAIHQNDVEFIKNRSGDFLAAWKDSNGNNLFLYAVFKNNTEMVKTILLILKRDLDQKKFETITQAITPKGRNAVELATLGNNLETLNYLHQELKLDLNYRDKDNKSALTFAIENNRPEIFNYLLLNGAQFTQQEIIAIGKNPPFQNYFNSPRCFLVILEAKNLAAFNHVFRFIKGLAPKDQSNYLYILNQKQQTPLLIAASLGEEKITNEILTLENKLYKQDVIARELTSAIGHTAAGMLPKAHPETKLRPYRSFKQEKERQLLRQIATQIYFGINEGLMNIDHTDDLVEIQILHLDYAGNHNLFVAANKFAVSKYMLQILANRENLTKILCTPHQVKTADKKEGEIRTKRYAQKIKQRVFNTSSILDKKEDKVCERSNQVATVLRNGQLEELVLTYSYSSLDTTAKEKIKKAFQQQNKIFLLRIDDCQNKLRHSEEFLTDIVEYAKTLERNIYSCVGGKKRPCIGCAGRMHHTIDQYSHNSGRFWLHTIKGQAKSASIETLKILCHESVSVTQAKNLTQAPEYDSGSDSEAEDEKLKAVLGAIPK